LQQFNRAVLISTGMGSHQDTLTPVQGECIVMRVSLESLMPMPMVMVVAADPSQLLTYVYALVTLSGVAYE
jgi:hypothetical protein